jgi:tripartite-type tricarboxylate transporter receptor subunit TctC
MQWLNSSRVTAVHMAALPKPSGFISRDLTYHDQETSSPSGQTGGWEDIVKLRILSLALTLCAVALPVQAAPYPDHAIRLIVPFAAGGGTDVLARIIAQKLNTLWGQPVVIENQSGASGAIGTRTVMKAPPDGYTLLMASTGALMTVSAGAENGAPFDVNKLLAPIAIGAAPPYLLVVSPNLPVNSTAELIALAKTKPGGLTYGSSGVGAASHLSGLLFASTTGIEMLHIPYKGTGPAVTDLLGGRIDVMFAPGPVVQSFVQSGQLKALGVTDNRRSKFYPGVPTVAESGAPNYESVGWFGLLAPLNTPKDIVDQLNTAIVAAMDTEDFRTHLATLGAEPKPQTPEEFGRYINADVAKWSKLVKDNDVQLPGGK